jgi:hypothetical protein
MIRIATFFLSMIFMMLLTNVVMAAGYWSTRLSDETPPLTTSNSRLIRAFHCSGRYCENINIRYQHNQSNHGNNTWTSWFSEEDTNTRICSGNKRFITGIACKGRFCDKLSLQCTTILNKSKRKGQCYWTSAFSEEQGLMILRKDYYAVGMQCLGGYCDNKRIYACKAFPD